MSEDESEDRVEVVFSNENPCPSLEEEAKKRKIDEDWKAMVRNKHLKQIARANAVGPILSIHMTESGTMHITTDIGDGKSRVESVSASTVQSELKRLKIAEYGLERVKLE